MEIKVFQGQIESVTADAVIVNLFEGEKSLSGSTGAVDRALNGAISELMASGDLTGKVGEVGLIYPRGLIPARRVVVVGLGKLPNGNAGEYFDLDAARRAAALAIKKARDLNAQTVATVIHGSGDGGLGKAAAAQALVEGSLLASYRYAAPKKSGEPKKEVQTLWVVESEVEKLAEVETGVRTAEAIVSGVCLARDLINMPANEATPTRMAQAAEDVAVRFGMKLTVGDREWAAQHGMGAFLGVAKGAGEPPKFIVLEHRSDQEQLDPIVLVGKGITFDTGGISIKPSDGLQAMKTDMSGAAAVIGTMMVVGQLNLPLRIIGITPCTENMPDGNAYRPGDVLTASNGKTIEIISTDAEGRLILADALAYAQQYHPKVVIDLATLTGACVVALGSGTAAGLFCNDEKLQQKLLASGQTTHERLWPLPLWEDYKKAIKSEVADMKNSGGRNGGVATSAVFLQEFIDYPWAHLDIAGMAATEKEDAYIPSGGVGFGVRLLVDFLRNW